MKTKFRQNNKLFVRILSVECIILCLALSACGKDENDSVGKDAKYFELQEQIAHLNKSCEDISKERDDLQKKETDYQDKIKELQKKVDSLQTEYDEYKAKMGSYEGLSEAETQAKELEALRIVEEEMAARAVKEAEEKEKQEAEIRKGYDTGITYDQINRLPDDYKDKKVKFSGYVIVTLEADEAIAFFLATSGKDKDILFCMYQPGEGKPRVFKDDTIIVRGTSVGLYKNKTDDGQSIVVPAIFGESIEISKSKVSSENGKSSANSSSSSASKGSSSGNQKNSSTSSASGYQEIYDEYAKKIKDATPRLINDYNSTAASNTDGIMGLAKIHNEKLSELAAISTEGVEKMASYMYTKGGGNYSEYQEWSTKLYSVYTEEGAKITNAYMSSCTGMFGF